MLVLILIPSRILLGEILLLQFFPKDLHISFFLYGKLILLVGNYTRQVKSKEKEKDTRQVIDQKADFID